HLQRRRDRSGAPRRIVELSVRARDPVAVAIRPSIVPAVLEDVDFFGRQVLVFRLDIVTFVLRHPDLFRDGIHSDTHRGSESGRKYPPRGAVFIVPHHNGAIRLLHAHVAARSDRDVHPTVWTEHDGPAPVSPATTVRVYALRVPRPRA